ncbi:MAG: CBS domain-containing protein, partial [Candidatus Nanohaloarchaea archaeon]|nr:CBS domain-containing protein [Candidatus Nanohaloarchaea archaeon]
MVSVRDITVEDVVEEDPPTINVGQPLSAARGVMEDGERRTVAVVDGDRFEGMLSYRDVLEKLRSDPGKTKVDRLLHTPPTVEEEQNLVELSRLRADSGRTAFVVLDEHDRLRGVVDEEDIAYAAADAEELEQLSVADVMTGELITVDASAPLDTARRTMMDEGVSRLVVMDGDELAGVITTIDILRAMVGRDQMSGGTSGRTGSMPGPAGGEVTGEKESLSDVPVRELMQSLDELDAELVDPSTDLSEAVHVIEDSHALEVVAVEDGDPVGIVTVKDVVDVVASHEAVDSLLVQLTGPEVPEEKQVIHDKIETQLRGGLGRLIERPDELTVHMKKYEKDGTQHKYTL